MRSIDKLHRLLVIIDGPQRSGKSTISDLLRRDFDHQVYVSEHLTPGSSFVRDELKGRAVDQRRNYVTELQLLERGLDLRQVVLYSTPLVLQQRGHLDAIPAITEEIRLYSAWHKLSTKFIPTIAVWTSEKSPVICAAAILEWVKLTIDSRYYADTQLVPTEINS